MRKRTKTRAYERRALPPATSTAQSVDVEDEPYDDEKDHIRCTDCKGSGYYVGFTERRLCPTCDGSGYL